MIHKSTFYWLWVGWIAYFAIVEGIAIYYGIKSKAIGDADTFTHFVATQFPMGIRIALLAWLVYHFVFVHKTF